VVLGRLTCRDEPAAFAIASAGSQCADSSLSFEEIPRNTRLSDDAAERSRLQLRVVWNGHRDGGFSSLLLHHEMATASSHFHESFGVENLADFSTRQDP
jgi:hypothetical protein